MPMRVDERRLDEYIVRIGYALFNTYLHPMTNNRHVLCTHRDVNRGRCFDRWVGLNFQAPHEDRMKELVIWLLVEVKLSGIVEEVAEVIG